MRLLLLKIFLISVILNLTLPPLGSWLNVYVTTQNGNKMPTRSFFGGALGDGDKGHVLMTQDSKYKLLSDIIPVPMFNPFTQTGGAWWIISVGDILIYSWYVTYWLTLISAALLTANLLCSILL